MSIVSIILQSLLILVFLMAGGSKITGAKMQVEAFKHLGLRSGSASSPVSAST